VPKLWNETIAEHRQAVREATLDAVGGLVAEHGLASVTMSQIAERTGIGRATLYKYFPDIETALLAWHERQMTGHLTYFAEVRDSVDGAIERLEAVLEAYALVRQRRRHQQGPTYDTEISAFLHRGEHVARVQRQIRDFIQALVVDAVEAGELRDDVAPGELASFCVHALGAAANLPSKAAARRLVMVTLAGMRAG
jgi:AcrR family transcriptional regulator